MIKDFLSRQAWLHDPWEGRRLSQKLALWLGAALIITLLCDRILLSHLPIVGWPLFVMSLIVIMGCGSILLLFIYSNVWGRYRLAERLTKSLRLQGDECVLNLNIKDGVLAAAIARQLTTGQVYGTANWRHERNGKGKLLYFMNRFQQLKLSQKITLETCSPLQTPFPDQMFEVVVFQESESLFLSDEVVPQLVQEIHRLLKPEGEYVILTFKRFERFRTLLKALGVGKCRFTRRLYTLFPPLKLLRAFKKTKPSD